eukprot:CAMPEP_0115869412 /NCGR_PEP_ID=MMETSP0287-20121206/21797_1 /TAXON_ID=412157 /ORGANISM="Chrysochromulina rotalis, Strain UIO044" /LENGTH=392 /DNA_ID=CAMNT_0003324101 /DNA_START=404 /DNA_END=1577 /DNA_ORIENTATION=-
MSGPSKARVHLITCDTRSGANESMLAQSLLAQMRADSQLTLQNVCANLEWMGVLTKVRAVLNFSASVAPWDAVLFAEPDALINVPLKADDLLLRFDLARGVHSLVFQAEPICYAPWGLWSAPGSTGLNGGSAALWGGPVFSQSYCQEHLLELYETSLEAAGVQPFQCPRFLNFGGFMGSATRLVEFMRMLLEPPAAMVARSNCFRSMNADRTGFSWEFGGDQCFAHHLLLERPQLQATLDRREMLFATGYVVRDSSESAPNALDGHQCGRSAVLALDPQPVETRLDQAHGMVTPARRPLRPPLRPRVDIAASTRNNSLQRPAGDKELDQAGAGALLAGGGSTIANMLMVIRDTSANHPCESKSLERYGGADVKCDSVNDLMMTEPGRSLTSG